MQRLFVFCLAGLASCHLADSSEPPKCEKGMHVNLSHCEADVLSGPTITIAAASGATACAATPTSIKVAPNGDFRFQNDDTVDHTITGADKQVWATVKATQPSAFIGIPKVGSWGYTVSGCSGTGTVVVE